MGQEGFSLEHVKASLAGSGSAGSSSDFDLNPGGVERWSGGATLRPSAVLVPLVWRYDGFHVILTKRASHLKHHPGQIAFPGGKVEPTDRDCVDTARREANEEIGLTDAHLTILGEMPFHETVTAFRISPVVAVVDARFRPRPDAGEVEEVFEVPLNYLGRPANFMVEGRFWAGHRRNYYVVPYGPYYIWGATARILRAFAERLSQ